MKLQEKGALKAFLQVRPLEDVLLRLVGDEECDAFFARRPVVAMLILNDRLSV